MNSEYGLLKDLVALAGAIMATSAAIAAAWRGRTRWEPSEEDLPKGALKVGALVAGVLIVTAWVEWRDPARAGDLNRYAISCAVLAVVALIVYGGVVGTQTYKKVLADGGSTREIRVIGGLWLTKRAREKLRERDDLTVQTLFAGAGYDEDRLWSRPSRQLAKTLCVVAYLSLTVSGTTALALAGIRLGLAVDA